MNFVIFDTEYVADKGLFEEGFEGWKNREIIQIAALKVNDSLEVVDSLNLYVKPTKQVCKNTPGDCIPVPEEKIIPSQGVPAAIV